MIWYLHWLQMRRATAIGAIGMAVGAGIFFLAFHRALHAPASSWGIPALEAHAAAVPLATLIAALFLAGNGLRGRSGGYAPALYTLSFPISRANIIGSRLMAGAVLLALAALLLLASNAGMLLLLSQPIPWTSMLRISLLAFAICLPMMTATSLVHLYLQDQWAAGAVWLVSAVGARSLGLMKGGVVSGPLWITPPNMWTAIGFSAAATALIVLLMIYLGQRKEI